MLTETERRIISCPETVNNAYKRNVYMRVRRKAKQAIEDLKFLANYLPESQQNQIFTPENIADLIDEILAYRRVPKSGGEKLPRMRGQKYTTVTEEDAMFEDTRRISRLPREIYSELK